MFCDWSPAAAIHRERQRAPAAAAAACVIVVVLVVVVVGGGGSRDEGRRKEGGREGRVGEEKRVITQTTIFTHFHPFLDLRRKVRGEEEKKIRQRGLLGSSSGPLSAS